MARQQRRLAAIVSVDVVGYSRLMQTDEAGTHARLKARHQELVAPKIAEHGGRVVKLMGDGLLAEFPSVVSATEWAIEVQAEVAKLNAGASSTERIEYRVGVNLGDVIVDDEDLYGDGVNLAARLQEVAEPNGVCLSDVAYQQVRGKVTVSFSDGGKVSLKNLADPVSIWNWTPESPDGKVSLASGKVTRLALPVGPSIAVLPFDNLSGDPEQEYFADGMVEEIITALSRLQWLFVIARNSSFAYKGKPIDVRTVSSELGVRYLLEGSVRKASNRVRITGQLIDASTGLHLWADRYDGHLEDIFDLQDRITENVVGAVLPKLRSAEIQRATRKRPENMDAYDYYLRALPHVYAMAEEANGEALRLLGKAIEIAPGFAAAKACAAWCYEQRVLQGFVSAGLDDVEVGVRLARDASELDREDPDVLAMSGFVLGMLGHEHEAALTAVDRSLAISPNSGQGLAFAAWVYGFVGDQERALDCFQRAMRLSPSDPLTYSYLTGAAMASLLMENPEEAVAFAQRSAHEYGKWAPTFRYLAASLAHVGRIAEARKALRRLMELDPHVSIERYRKQLPFTQPRQFEYLLEGLRKAGLPESGTGAR